MIRHPRMAASFLHFIVQVHLLDLTVPGQREVASHYITFVL
uniref:Uncharacterized protein n=1 Tax=Arundo donax TaxID=35708 RepID=A0A0A9B231_ARUDO